MSTKADKSTVRSLIRELLTFAGGVGELTPVSVVELDESILAAVGRQ